MQIAARVLHTADHDLVAQRANRRVAEVLHTLSGLIELAQPTGLLINVGPVRDGIVVQVAGRRYYLIACIGTSAAPPTQLINRVTDADMVARLHAVFTGPGTVDASTEDGAGTGLTLAGLAARGPKGRDG